MAVTAMEPDPTGCPSLKTSVLAMVFLCLQVLAELQLPRTKATLLRHLVAIEPPSLGVPSCLPMPRPQKATATAQNTIRGVIPSVTSQTGIPIHVSSPVKGYQAHMERCTGPDTRSIREAGPELLVSVAKAAIKMSPQPQQSPYSNTLVPTPVTAHLSCEYAKPRSWG